jgi:AraC-like DNA-binding protein
VMVIATVAGTGFAVTPRGETALTSGTLYAGQPGEPVGWGIDGDTWRMAWWYFTPGPRWKTWQTMAPTALLADLFTDLLDRRGPLAADTAGLLLHHLTTLAAPAPPVDRFAEIWREVELHPGDAWSLPALARRLDVSISTAQRLAQKHLGCAPHVALVRLRMAHARELLKRTTYPIQTVAELVGYGDAFTFSAAYRRWAGQPPSQERAT